MFDIFTDMLKQIYASLVTDLQQQIKGMYDYALNADTYLADYIPNFSNVYNLIFRYAMLIIVIKFLAKGISTWVLWTDGDPDQDPFIMLTSFFKAMIGCLCFGELYRLFITVVKELLDKIIAISHLSVNDLVMQDITEGTFLTILLALLYAVLVFIMSVMMRVTGLQLMILRLGFPLASSGMLDADGGSYKPYIKIYVQIALTVIVQTFMINLSLQMLINGNGWYALATVIMAFITPAFLQQFVMQGGQLGQKISSGLMAMSSFKRIIH